jgi:hypothetical protein
MGCTLFAPSSYIKAIERQFGRPPLVRAAGKQPKRGRTRATHHAACASESDTGLHFGSAELESAPGLTTVGVAASGVTSSR